MDHRFKVIFFDLGDTLIYDKDPWEPIFPLADAAMRRSLEKDGYPLSTRAYGEFKTIFDLYYHRRQDTLIEETTVQLLRELLETKRISPPDSVLYDAMQAMYAVTQDNWCVEADAEPTLRRLRDNGYRLGVISNAADDENVQELIDKANLRSYLEYILSSAACGFRKPHPDIFQRALDYFHVPAQNTAMVGDRLDADILGANQKGIYSIWITRRAESPPEGDLIVQPQACISSLNNLPGLINNLG